MDNKDGAARSAAAERARSYRNQANAFRQLADTEPLEQKSRLLLTSAAKFDELAAGEEMVAYGERRTFRYWVPGTGQPQ